jgi:hypothetical protein
LEITLVIIYNFSKNIKYIYYKNIYPPKPPQQVAFLNSPLEGWQALHDGVDCSLSSLGGGGLSLDSQNSSNTHPPPSFRLPPPKGDSLSEPFVSLWREYPKGEGGLLFFVLKID